MTIEVIFHAITYLFMNGLPGDKQSVHSGNKNSNIIIGLIELIYSICFIFDTFILKYSLGIFGSVNENKN